MANFLIINFRNSDIVCRLGGDEFLVICTESDVESSFKAANKLIEKGRTIQKTNPLKYWDISFSIGVAGASRQDIDTAQKLLKKADNAMYTIKKNGGDGVSKV